MKYLVTGGAGFLGTHLVSRLLDRGEEVRVLDVLASPVHSPDRPYTPPAGVEFAHGSVEDPGAWQTALSGIDRVFHLAGYADYHPDFSKYFRVNAVGTALLYETIVGGKLPVGKVVVASSQAIYGEGIYACERDGEVAPDQREMAQLDRGEWEPGCPVCSGRITPLAARESRVYPHNSYAMSKSALEQIALRLGKRYGIPSVALRYSIVQGPGQSIRNAYSGALRSFAVRVLNGRAPVVFEDGKQLRDYVNVHDVTDATILAMESDEANYRSLNVGGDRWVTVTELAELVIEVAGAGVKCEVPGTYRLGDGRHIVSDVSALRRLGWAPTRSLREGVAEYIDWLRQQPEVPDTFEQAAENMRRLGVLRGTEVK